MKGTEPNTSNAVSVHEREKERWREREKETDRQTDIKRVINCELTD